MKRIKKIIPGFIIALLLISSTVNAQTPLIAKESQLGWLAKWFTAWELMNKDLLLLPPDPAPEMLFFDGEHVYTTSVISSPNGHSINGPALLGEKLQWRMDSHTGKIILPTGDTVPVGLMSFAGPAKDEKGKKFFVMAAPSYWKEAGIKAAELGLDNLLIGVFLHEFAHTRQMEGFGAVVAKIEKEQTFEKELTDDIVQDYFKKDSLYVQYFHQEVDKFYEAVFAGNMAQTKKLGADAMLLFKTRQLNYFTKEKTILNKLDNIFLTMEGLGQYMAVAWLTHPKGANMNYKVAVTGFRRGKNQWSQDEGLALFLLLTKLTNPDWTNDMFGKEPVYITDLLEKAIQKK